MPQRCRGARPRFRGAYGTTPWAFNPMSAVMLRNMGNGAAVGDIGATATSTSSCSASSASRAACSATSSQAEGARALRRRHGGRRPQEHRRQPDAAFADLDNDGDRTSSSGTTGTATRPATLRASTATTVTGTFTDVTATSGFAPVGYLVGGLSLADFDRDGLLDIYISYWTMELGGDPSAARLHQGPVPRAEPAVSEPRRPDLPGRDARCGPRRGDGRQLHLDLRRLHPGRLGRPLRRRRPPRDLFFVNDGAAFRVASNEYGLTHVGNDMGVAVTDLESDGLLDLYATNISDATGRFGNSQGNTLMVGAARRRRPRDLLGRGSRDGRRGHRLGLGHRVHRHEPRRPDRPYRRPGDAGVHRPAGARPSAPGGAAVPERGNLTFEPRRQRRLRPDRRPARRDPVRLRPRRRARPADHPDGLRREPARERHDRSAAG